jgi:signal transduction histidine kinase/CheY-like chemotaxis protein
MSAESVDLETLVHCRNWLEASLPLEVVQRQFKAIQVEYLPVVKAGRVIGLCGRGQVGFVMGSRFGFAIFSKDPVETVMVPKPLVVRRSSALRDVLGQALFRHGDEFREDAILVDDEQHLIGLIKVESLAQLQSRLVNEQLGVLQRQHATLSAQNLELFHANNAARQSKGLYLGLFASHTLGVALLDETGVIHEHNGRLSEILGIDDPTLAAGTITGWIVENEREAFLDLLDSLARGLPTPANHEFRFDIPGRGVRTVRCSTGWIKETGQICACFDDVTEQRSLEQSVSRQEKQTLLDTLVGGIAHELNNKMAPIMGFAELLRLESSAGHSEYIGLIIKSVREAARIIRQLLELSKPATHTLQTLDLRAVAEETLTILKFQIRETGCTVRSVLPSSPIPIRADAGQLKQVMLNLAINAIHAMEQTEHPVLTLEIRRSGDAAEMVVSDNGCGISEENLTRIFDPFFTTKGPEKGTGLGLSVCFSIIRQYGGDIRVESRPGHGTCFTVSLQTVDEMVLLPADRAGPGRALPAILSGARVLVVEDEVIIRRLLQEILCTRLGCTVVLVSNGAEALEALRKGPFALILSDIRMPKMNGKEFYLRLKESHPDLCKRLVFITGHAGDRRLGAEISSWNVPVISKPFTFERLAEVCAPILHEAARTCA